MRASPQETRKGRTSVVPPSDYLICHFEARDPSLRGSATRHPYAGKAMINDKAVADQVNKLILDAYRDLEKSMQLVESSCPPDEFAHYKAAIGKVTASILFNLLEPLYEKIPTLKPIGWDA